jgi:hypothetical protein
MNLKLSESESIICELTTRNDEIKAKENSISVINRTFKHFFVYLTDLMLSLTKNL